jgi:2-polyprenyl-6-hydroxyphenyl methylase / 3-demethylubiquinone-9 3-methyltransferase
MTNATVANATIRADEAAHFGKLAAQWWDPKGSSAMLHKLNPVRLAFLRDSIDAHWGGDGHQVRPLAGKCALDVGCGAGLLCEPLARLGAAVTGVDAAAENIAAARDHAEAMGLDIAYRQGELQAFVAALAAHLAPGGLMVLSTPNRTPASRLLLVGAAEAVGAVPRGTHHWEDFITPDDLRTLLAEAGLTMGEPRGIAFNPLRGLELSGDLSLNYIVTATR